MVRRALVGVLVLGTAACANPEGGVAVQNAIIRTIPSRGFMVVENTGSRAIVNWQSFSNVPGERIHFFQRPDAATLNRVVGPTASSIGGEITGSGTVYILNPNGVLFTPTAQVNVGGLVASSLSMSDQQFNQMSLTSGAHTLTQDPAKPQAAVVNQGEIAVSAGGLVVLAAPVVSNQGTIRAPGGKVALVAGTDVTIEPDRAPAFAQTFGRSTHQNVVAPAGSVDDALARVVNDGQLVPAGTVSTQNGVVTLGSAEGVAVNSGRIEADRVGDARPIVQVAGSQAAVHSARAEIQAREALHVGITSFGRVDVAGSIRAPGGGNVWLKGQNGARVTGFIQTRDPNLPLVRGDIHVASAARPEDDNVRIVGGSGTGQYGEITQAFLSSADGEVSVDANTIEFGAMQGGVLTLGQGAGLNLKAVQSIAMADPRTRIIGDRDSAITLSAPVIHIGDLLASKIQIRGADGRGVEDLRTGQIAGQEGAPGWSPDIQIFSNGLLELGDLNAALSTVEIHAARDRVQVIGDLTARTLYLEGGDVSFGTIRVSEGGDIVGHALAGTSIEGGAGRLHAAATSGSRADAGSLDVGTISLSRGDLVVGGDANVNVGTLRAGFNGGGSVDVSARNTLTIGALQVVGDVILSNPGVTVLRRALVEAGKLVFTAPEPGVFPAPVFVLGNVTAREVLVSAENATLHAIDAGSHLTASVIRILAGNVGLADAPRFDDDATRAAIPVQPAEVGTAAPVATPVVTPAPDTGPGVAPDAGPAVAPGTAPFVSPGGAPIGAAGALAGLNGGGTLPMLQILTVPQVLDAAHVLIGAGASNESDDKPTR